MKIRDYSVQQTHRLLFGQEKQNEGWTIVIMSPSKAIEFHFDLESEARGWIGENIDSDKWQRVSFRGIAFKDRGTAIMYKLLWG